MTALASNTATAERAPRRGLSIALWVTQALLALFFIWVGVPKILGDATSVASFELIGYGQWFRVLTGLVEVAGGVGLLIPRLSSLAAFGLAIVMVCASAVNLAYLDMGPVSLLGTGAFFAAFAYIGWVRRGQNRALLELLRR